jgi:hypothetical protein
VETGPVHRRKELAFSREAVVKISTYFTPPIYERVK